MMLMFKALIEMNLIPVAGLRYNYGTFHVVPPSGHILICQLPAK